MQIKYSITGAKRKQLVQAIVCITGFKTKYLGAPSFAYEVGGFIVDRDGILTGADDFELVADLQGLHSFVPISTEYDSPPQNADSVPENIAIPYAAALGGRVSPYRDFEEPPAYGTPKAKDGLMVEFPRAGMSDMAIENLRRLVASKATLIQKALDTDNLTIEANDEIVCFSWFQHLPEPEMIHAFTTLVSRLVAQAKALQRVNTTGKAFENEKYAFRVFLLRLGMIGVEYKAVRKTLLKNLSGNSAFRSVTLNEGVLK